MHGDRLQWAVLGALVVLAIVGVWTLREMTALGAAFQVSTEREEPNMQTITEVVATTADPNRKVTVSTTRNEGESDDSFKARHNAGVATAKSL